MEQFFKKAITDKLPTLAHYKQLCHTLSVRGPPYNKLDIFAIETMATIKDIQTYMFNILSQYGTIVGIIEYVEKFKFYIAPNIYTDKLTLKQFFHCIDIKYNGRHNIDTCTYKYNIFYKGEKFDNVYDHNNNYSSRSPINKQFISCYRIGVTEGTDDNNFKNLPIEHFTTLLKIMGKEYASCVASYENDYIYKYWEDKDIDVFLDYIMKGKRYYYIDDCNNYIKCILEKNIIKNNYSQEKLLPLYEKYSACLTSTAWLTSPLAICYNSITTILKKYINFPTVRLGFDNEAVQTITPTIIPDEKSEPEIIDKIVCIVPHKIQQNLIRSYIISDFIILESGKIIFRTKDRKEPYIDGKYVESISYKYTVYECDPNLFNKQVCINMFSNRYTGKGINIGEGLKVLAPNIGEGVKELVTNIGEGLKGLAPNMVLYYDTELPPYIKIDFSVEPYNRILPNRSNEDFMTTFINAEYNKTHIYRLYIMSKTIGKFLALKHTNEELQETNAELQEANAKLQEANAALKERTKILDESHF